MEFNLEGYEIQELSDIEKQNLKNNFKKKKLNFKKIVTVAAALVLTVGIFSQTETGKYVYALLSQRFQKYHILSENLLALKEILSLIQM
jgi:hypothetical protein